MTFDEASSTPRVLLGSLGFGESPRWHDGRLWVRQLGQAGDRRRRSRGQELRSFMRVPTTIPFCVDWLPDGRILGGVGTRGATALW